MLNFNEFVNAIKEEVEKNLDADYAVKVKEVIKTNDIVLTGISVIPKARKDELIMSPVVYLETFFAEYEKGLSLAQVAYDLTKMINSSMQYGLDTKKKFEENLSKDNIIVKLVGRDSNEERVRSLPHIDIEDMTKEFKLLVSSDPEEMVTAAVTYEIMYQLGIANVEELDALAQENTKRLLPSVANNMRDILFELSGGMSHEDMDLHIDSMPQLIVVSNQYRNNGAHAILDTEFMHDIAMKEQDDLLIMPSSLHECILVKASDIDLQAAHAMVTEVNLKEVEASEKLTDSVYIYDKDSRRIELAYNDMIRDVLKDIRKYGIESELLTTHSELNNNKAFMMQAIAINKDCFKVCSDRLMNDKSILGAAISRNAEKFINEDREDRDLGTR